MELVLKGITAQIMQHSWNIFKSVAEMSKAHNYYPVQTSSESDDTQFLTTCDTSNELHLHIYAM